MALTNFTGAGCNFCGGTGLYGRLQNPCLKCNASGSGATTGTAPPPPPPGASALPPPAPASQSPSVLPPPGKLNPGAFTKLQTAMGGGGGSSPPAHSSAPTLPPPISSLPPPIASQPPNTNSVATPSTVKQVPGKLNTGSIAKLQSAMGSGDPGSVTAKKSSLPPPIALSGSTSPVPSSSSPYAPSTFASSTSTTQSWGNSPSLQASVPLPPGVKVPEPVVVQSTYKSSAPDVPDVIKGRCAQCNNVHWTRKHIPCYCCNQDKKLPMPRWMAEGPDPDEEAYRQARTAPSTWFAPGGGTSSSSSRSTCSGCKGKGGWTGASGNFNKCVHCNGKGVC